MNTQISGDLSSDQKISDVFHAFGCSIPVAKDGRRMWHTKFKQSMLQKLKAKELSVAEISAACKMDQSTVYQWKRELRHKKAKQLVSPSQQPTTFAEIKVSDNVSTRSVTQNTIVFRCKAFELNLPPDYPLDGVMRIIQKIDGRL